MLESLTMSNGKSGSLNIAYIGGGSHNWAWVFMTDLSRESELSGTVRLYDIDKGAARTNQAIGERLMARDDTVGRWSFETADTLSDALYGADFVVISILPGTFDEMESDVHLPERCGIYQSVGDTAGPGGLVRALRAIPMFAEIGKAIMRYCPDAWVINYTNPMALLVRTLYQVFPGIKAFGCCHEVFGTQKLLSDILCLEKGLVNIKREDIIVNIIGLNHFTWFTAASYRDIDIFPVYRHFIEENYEDGYNDPDRNWMNSTFNCAHRVKFDLFLKYGSIAAAGDRHLAEFMPGEIYLKDPETVRSWKFSLTPVSWRKEQQALKNDQALRLASGTERLDMGETGEEGVRIMKALCGLERFITNVNIPNYVGQIPDFPRDTVVETNAVFSRDSLSPVYAGRCPDKIMDLMRPHISSQELILDASLNCDFEKAYQAFMDDPLVKGRISDSDGRELLKDMIANTFAHLPEAWGKQWQ